MPFAELPDARLHYEVSGEAGSPVLLIMGFGVPGRLWRRQAEALSEHHRVAWFDNAAGGQSRGRGPMTLRSMARATAGLVEHLGWDAAHVVGISMGGMIAQEVALRHRARVRSLALLATHAGGLRSLVPSARGVGLFVQGFLGPRARRAHAMQRLVWPEHYLERVDRRALTETLRREVTDATRTRDRLAQLTAVLGHGTARRLHRLAGLPTLVVKAGEDVLIRPADVERLAALIPGARLVSFDDAGHGLLHQYGERLNDILLEHLAAADGR